VLHTAGEDFADWAAMVFQEWGTHLLPELVAEALDGDVEYVLDELYAEAVNLCCPVNLCWLAGANYTSSAKDLKRRRLPGRCHIEQRRRERQM
jgi:hypothetical protein